MNTVLHSWFSFRSSRVRVALCVLSVAHWWAAHSPAAEPSPFSLAPSVVTNHGVRTIVVAIEFPEHHHIYAERLSFELDGAATAFQLPAAKRVADKFSGEDRLVYERAFQATRELAAPGLNDTVLTVNLQGCSESECYFPETHRWKIHPDNSVLALVEDAGTTMADGTLTNGFEVAARATGFVSSRNFLRLLEASRGGAGAARESGFAGLGLTATLGLILLGGLALNLTPCVLPMIPINLAILGAGARRQNRRHGFALGAAYGCGMAIVYGSLGLVVVLTGSKFGALNASAWFNFAIAAVFVVLALAMFDKIAIDFSRFQRSGKSGASHGVVLAAVIMGAISALLAGACVAPVLISVLLLATTLYQDGNLLGLLLPFVLGIGMAVPWPFAGAGLSFLPKPGAWMTRVKYMFGVVILGFALWYGWLGLNLAGLGHDTTKLASARSDSLQQLQAALEQSRTNGRPVVVDFWASWCKNCEAMEHSTFRDPAVRERLANEFLLVKFQAEQLNDPLLKPVLDQFGVVGLPTCVVLKPAPPAIPREF